MSGMTKAELFQAFDERISKSSIVERDGEYVIQGKWCVIAFEPPDLWDIWVCNPTDLYSGLDQRKLRNITRGLQISGACGVVRELTGEADVRVTDKEVILSSLALLGIK